MLPTYFGKTIGTNRYPKKSTNNVALKYIIKIFRVFFFNIVFFSTLLTSIESTWKIVTELEELNAIPIIVMIPTKLSAKLNSPTSCVV
jgi:hypothetical protein